MSSSAQKRSDSKMHDVKAPKPLMNKSLRLQSETRDDEGQSKVRAAANPSLGSQKGDALVLPQDANLRVLAADREAVRKEHKLGNCAGI